MNQKPEAKAAGRTAGSVPRLVGAHSCEKELKRTPLWMSGYNLPGNKWTCPCGRRWVYDIDEASGGAWYPDHSRPNSMLGQTQGGNCSSQAKK